MGYKVLASLILQRLKDAGSESRLSNSQFGFRPNRGTADALFIVRRIIEATIDDRDASLYVVLLDWSKAFDRIKHDALMSALHRFGVRGPFLELIGAIYRDRSFSVIDAGCDSRVHEQLAGIAQGCPLSPYLFIILMTVVMVDAKALTNGVEPKPYIVSPDVVYADDTLLMSSSPVLVQKLLDNVALTGRSYGLELNLDKTVLLRVRGQEYIFSVDGKPLKIKTDTYILGVY